MEKNQDKINWDNLSNNQNAISLLKKNKNKINWSCLSLNKNAIELLEKNKDKLYWSYFSQNSNIFTYDYIKMKENIKNNGIAEELMAFIFHPKNMNKWINWGFSEHEDFLKIID